jgi:hypothetical protein
MPLQQIGNDGLIELEAYRESAQLGLEHALETSSCSFMLEPM